MDQPDRRGLNFIMLGSSLYSAHWGKSAHIGYMSSKLPSCVDCQEEILNGEYPTNIGYIPICTKCANWDVCAPNRLMDFPPPKNYPKSLLKKTKN